MAKRIDVSGLTAYYGSHKAIEDISMSIEPRSVTAFIGPSGCGKSTFLRTLNRMHEVTPGGRVEGCVRYRGIDLYDSDVSAAEVRRHIGMVFQKPNPFPMMSIEENVIAGLRLAGERVGKATVSIKKSKLKKGKNKLAISFAGANYTAGSKTVTVKR